MSDLVSLAPRHLLTAAANVRDLHFMSRRGGRSVNIGRPFTDLLKASCNF